jgi:hypothetical protein
LGLNSDKVSNSTTNDKLCFADLICINYTNEYGDTKSGIINVEVEFSRSDLSIKYIDVGYSDPELLKHVENRPNVLRNVDAYLRNKLLKVEYNI